MNNKPVYIWPQENARDAGNAQVICRVMEAN